MGNTIAHRDEEEHLKSTSQHTSYKEVRDQNGPEHGNIEDWNKRNKETENDCLNAVLPNR